MRRPGLPIAVNLDKQYVATNPQTAESKGPAMSFASLTRERYSCRHYTNEPVSEADLAAILEAGRIAPSACNNHPSRVVVCNTPELTEAAAAAAHYFAKDGSVFGAPLVLLVVAKTEDAWVRKHDDMSASLIDTSIVVDQMMMQAVELGLGTCWVCHFDPAVARERFDLPDEVYPIHMLTVGHPADAIADPSTREARTIPLERFLDVRA